MSILKMILLVSYINSYEQLQKMSTIYEDA